MKNLNDIEKLSFEQLEAIADDNSIKAPKSLKEDIFKSLTASSAVSNSSRKHKTIVYGISVSTAFAALALALVLTIGKNSYPSDTYNDPRLAYAEIEKTFSFISTKINTGLKTVEEAVPELEKPSNIINKISKK